MWSALRLLGSCCGFVKPREYWRAVAKVFGIKRNSFLSLRFLCRANRGLEYKWLSFDSGDVGWPEHARESLLQVSEESPPPAAGAEAYRPHGLTSTVLHARLSDRPFLAVRVPERG